VFGFLLGKPRSSRIKRSGGRCRKTVSRPTSFFRKARVQLSEGRTNPLKRRISITIIPPKIGGQVKMGGMSPV
jgi:hypothetical protein